MTNLGWHSRPMRVILSLSLLAILVFIAWRSINYISGTRPSYDSSIFAGTAVHMMAGRVLYRDVWDHKPPMVFLLNLCALKFGDGTINAVRLVERIFAVVGGALLFWMVFAAFGSRFLAFFAALFFLVHMYYPPTFEAGNSTEEYGAVFLIGGMGAAFAARRLKGSYAAMMVCVSGFVFSLAVLFKEPFILPVLPWLVYVSWPQNGKWKPALIQTGLFIVGALVPVVMLAVWLRANGALSAWIDTTLYSFFYASEIQDSPSAFDLSKAIKSAYEQVGKAMVITRIAAGIGLVSLLDRLFVKKHHYLPFAIFASTFTSFIATCLANRYYGHYYMMLVPTYVLLATCGLAFVIELLRRVRVRQTMALFLVFGALVFADGMNLKYFGRRLARPALRWQGDVLTQYVIKHSKQTDTIWAPSYPYTYFYLDTGRLSPTKWITAMEHFFVTTPDSTREEKLASLHGDLERNRPRLILITKDGVGCLERLGLAGWLRSHYKIAIDSESETPEALQVWIYAE